jgi:hypothetical protein
MQLMRVPHCHRAVHACTMLTTHATFLAPLIWRSQFYAFRPCTNQSCGWCALEAMCDAQSVTLSMSGLDVCFSIFIDDAEYCFFVFLFTLSHLHATWQPLGVACIAVVTAANWACMIPLQADKQLLFYHSCITPSNHCIRKICVWHCCSCLALL